LKTNNKAMSAEFVKVIPVLESADIARDISWYKEKTGFEVFFLMIKCMQGLILIFFLLIVLSKS